MSSLAIKPPNKRGTLYGKNRPVTDYKQGDTVYYTNLNGKVSYGKILGFRKELTDYCCCKSPGEKSTVSSPDILKEYSNFLSFMVQGLMGEAHEVFLSDVVFSFSRSTKLLSEKY